jgi:hypothetical protein
MIESNLQEISKRLDKVEKQNRYMKLAGVVFLSAVVVSLLAGAANKPDIPKEIRAHRIVMVDSVGRERIVMEIVDAMNVAVIRVNNSKGTPLVCIDGLQGLTIGDTNGDLRVLLKKDKLNFIYPSDQDKGNSPKTGIVLSIDATMGYSKLSLHPAKEKGVVLLSSRDHEMNGGLISVSNKTGEPIILLEADEYGNGVVGAYNRKGMGRTLKPGP